ncbi:MAG: phosphoglycolate phosphatase [Gammaproteobacteria bacterium]
MSQSLQAVLFDLDGTLIDTAQDLAEALNRTLTANARPTLPFNRIRPTVSLGAAAMLQLGFGITEAAAEFADLRQQFLHHYEQAIAVHSKPFPEIDTVLDNIEGNGIAWGIVTNKPAHLTQALLTALCFSERTACVVAGDTLPVRKPDPAPMLHACDILNCDPAHTLYVGDAERDVQAGKRAGMQTLVAAYGYLGDVDQPADWGADGIIDSPIRILDWLARPA